MAEKIIVAPQIIIYKNLFKNSENLIKELEHDKDDSLFSKWETWYSQGYRKQATFNSKELLSSNEFIYLKEIYDNIDYIKKDYFEMFKGNNGIWPSFIKDWDHIIEQKDIVYIDYFKYNSRSQNHDKNLNAMDYHVDDFLLDSDSNGMRHVITINFYLNNSYSGGEICAYDSYSGKSYKYKPNPGDAVVMPSTAPFYHAVKDFDSERYFLRSFVDYYVDGKNDWDELLKNQKNYVLNDMQIIKIESVEEEIK